MPASGRAPSWTATTSTSPAWIGPRSAERPRHSESCRVGPLLDAYTRAEADGFTGTDTAGCIATYTDLPVLAVPAPATNLKVTFAEDLALAERLLDS